MIKFIAKSVLIVTSFLFTSCYSNSLLSASKIGTSAINPSTIKNGADNYEKYLPLLKDKKIGIVTNQTGILSDKTHLVDFLLEKKIAIHTIFAPEHGFRGTADAGEHVVDGKDQKTGLPIISL